MPNFTNVNTLPVITVAGLFIEGTEGNDSLNGSEGADEMHGLGGRDFIGGLGGDDRLFGEGDADDIRGDAGADLLDGGTGDDFLTGGAGADTLIGGQGFDTASYITAGLGVTVDLTSGGATNDAVGDTFDSIEKFLGSNLGDIFNGNAGDNNFDGFAGDDWLIGQAGNDILSGGAGDDNIIGGSGNDLIRGGPGIDRLTGDADRVLRGFDDFVIAKDEGADIITDFQHGIDVIRLVGFDFGSTPFGTDGFLAGGFIGDDRFGNHFDVDKDSSGLDVHDHLYLDTKTGNLLEIHPTAINGHIASLGTHAHPVKVIATLQGDFELGHSDILFSDVSAPTPRLVFHTNLQLDNWVFQFNATTAQQEIPSTTDLDGDHADDVVFQNGATGQVYFAKMVDGAFQSWGAATGVLGQDWKAVGVGNVNPGAGSGAEVFVQQQSTGTIYYASQDTGQTTWGAVSTNLSPEWKLRAVGDVTGDGSADAVVQNASTGTIYYADMHDGAFQNWGVVNTNLTADWKAVGVGDINADGFADVVVQQQSTGTTYLANMANGAFAGWGVVSTNLTPDWQVKAVGDVTGDGFADVLFQQASTGTTYYADMKNGAFDHWGVAAQNIDASWKVEGLADVDSDGTQDVLFQHVTDGSTLYAHMGPNGFDHWGVVTQNVSSDWHVV